MRPASRRVCLFHRALAIAEKIDSPSAPFNRSASWPRPNVQAASDSAVRAAAEYAEKLAARKSGAIQAVEVEPVRRRQLHRDDHRRRERRPGAARAGAARTRPRRQRGAPPCSGWSQSSDGWSAQRLNGEPRPSWKPIVVSYSSRRPPSGTKGRATASRRPRASAKASHERRGAPRPRGQQRRERQRHELRRRGERQQRRVRAESEAPPARTRARPRPARRWCSPGARAARTGRPPRRRRARGRGACRPPRLERRAEQHQADDREQVEEDAAACAAGTAPQLPSQGSSASNGR